MPKRGRPKRVLPKELIEKLYWEHGLTVDKVSKELQCSQSVLIREMDRYGIPRRKMHWH